MSRYRLGSIERELEVYLGGGPQWEAAWLPRVDYRRHAAEILPNELAHSKADPEIYPLTDRLRVRLVHFPVRVEASVLHGKANQYGPRHAGEGVPRLIVRLAVRWAAYWAAPREPVVPVSPRSTHRLACLVACPVALLGVEPPLPWLVYQWFLAENCVPADVRAAYPHPLPADRAGSRLVCRRTCADLSTPFWQNEVRRLASELRQTLKPRQTLEPRQAWERKQPASGGGPPAGLGA